MWIAKSRYGAISLWHRKPRYDYSKEEWVGDGTHLILYSDKDIPKELTFENSPMEIELKIKEK